MAHEEQVRESPAPQVDRVRLGSTAVARELPSTCLLNAERRVQFLPHHDAPTGLANRSLLLIQLDRALHRARRNHATVAVLFFDLDNFSDVNDTFGHDAGDQLLLVVAQRLRSVTRAGETVARLGADQFVVVLEDITAGRQPPKVMRRLLEKLREPTNILGTDTCPVASVGMAIFPRDGNTADELLQHANANLGLTKLRTSASGMQAATPEQPLVSRFLDLVTRARR